MDPAARQQLLTSPSFRRLVATRWRVSLALTACLFVLYYGFVLLVALNKPLLATRYGGSTPIGIPIGAAVIIGSWVLTAIYIVWANRSYDREAERIRSSVPTDA
jgi:uncharacterized membrane protein (DUF485 family)